MILTRCSRGQRLVQETVVQAPRLPPGEPYREPRRSPTARPSSQLRAARLPTHAAQKPTALEGEH